MRYAAMMTKMMKVLMFAMVMTGCQSSLLVIRHQDPTQPIAEVSIDGVDQGAVRYGEELELRVKPGAHTLSLTPPGSKTNAWSDDQRPVDFVMDEMCVVTLMTPDTRQQASDVEEKEQ